MLVFHGAKATTHLGDSATPRASAWITSGATPTARLLRELGVYRVLWLAEPGS